MADVFVNNHVSASDFREGPRAIALARVLYNYANKKPYTYKLLL